MVRIGIIALAMLLAGCAQINAAHECRRELGPQPYAAAGLFGVVGWAVAEQDAEYRDYNKRLYACIQGRT